MTSECVFKSLHAQDGRYGIFVLQLTEAYSSILAFLQIGLPDRYIL